jgi:hypothetical protein
MMKSVEEFFKKFKEAQTCGSIEPQLASPNSKDFQLDSTLISAVKRGWHIAPFFARGKYFLRSALAGKPTQSLAQIHQWSAEQCGWNWAVETGKRSGLLILEFNYDIGPQTMLHLCGGEWSWRTTLQFTNSNSRFVCFIYSGQKIRNLSEKFQGLRVHCGDYVLIPPSSTSKGEKVSYLNPASRLLNFPDWLLDSSRIALKPRMSVRKLVATT